MAARSERKIAARYEEEAGASENHAAAMCDMLAENGSVLAESDPETSAEKVVK